MYKWVKKLLEPCPYGLIEKLCDKYTTTNDSFIGIIFSPLGRSLSRIRGIRDHDINKLSRKITDKRPSYCSDFIHDSIASLNKRSLKDFDHVMNNEVLEITD